MRHLEALTTGVTRRAAIQRTLLPVMLGWFADEADPDAGLLAFRRVSEKLGSTQWYLKMLRDEGSAAERLAHVLGRSRYAADLLVRAAGVGLDPRRSGRARAARPRRRSPLTMRGAPAARRPGRRHGGGRGAPAARAAPHRLGRPHRRAHPRARRVALSDLAAATLEVVLEVAEGVVDDDSASPDQVDMLVVGMGRLGGAEMGYGSDADVLFVHRSRRRGSRGRGQRQAVSVVQEMVRLLERHGPGRA